MSTNPPSEIETYPWTRYWCPRSSSVRRTNGFTVDPEVTFATGLTLNPDLRRLEELEAVPVVILLGEPGIGKRWVLLQESEETKMQLQSVGNVAIIRNLRGYASEDRLIRDVFECSEMGDWERGSHTLHLLLDSLDECALLIEQVAALLGEEFQSRFGGSESAGLRARFRLRIACRTADWSNVLEQGLRSAFGKDAVQVYELAPLRERDVIDAARAEGFDPDRFLQAVRASRPGVFASKPVTLRLLFKLFMRDQTLPDREADIYAQGRLALCDETSPHRLELPRRKGIGRLEANERLALAERIVVASVLGSGPLFLPALPPISHPTRTFTSRICEAARSCRASGCRWVSKRCGRYLTPVCPRRGVRLAWAGSIRVTPSTWRRGTAFDGKSRWRRSGICSPLRLTASGG